MTGHMREAAKKGGTAYSGRAPRKVAAEFRNRLKSGLQCITARTIGSMIACMGYQSGPARSLD